jgi:hypothetical protein
MPNKIGILVSATDTGTPGTGTGVWDGYIAILKRQISGSPIYREEPNTSSHGAEGHKAKYDKAANDLAGDTDVKVIVTGGAFAAQCVQKYTTTKPLVVASAGDYGPNFNDLFQTAGGFVDRIFNHGASAASIPVFNTQVANCVIVE